MNTINKIELLLQHEFERIPFHNLFMLNKKIVIGSPLGGTCSDRVLHFKKVLIENGIPSTLHSAFINNVECHRMLTVELDNLKYFIDVGSGWPSIKLFPAFRPIMYDAYGMTFKTHITNTSVLLFHRTDKEFKLMTTIPFETKTEEEILQDINHRYDSNNIYPFQNSLRFSKVIDNKFLFLRGNCLRIYETDSPTIEIMLDKNAIYEHLTKTFLFDLQDLKYNFP